MKKSRMIGCVIFVSILVIVSLFFFFFVSQSNNIKTMEKAIEIRFSKEILNDWEKADKVEYCPSALEKHKIEVEHSSSNKKSYTELLEENQEKRKNLGLQYDVQNVVVLDKEECDSGSVFLEDWNVTGIEKAYRVTISYEKREKYEFNSQKYNEAYYKFLIPNFREEDNGVWSEWRTFEEVYLLYEVNGSWYCKYDDA